jgi:hypothetical protein
VLEEERNSLFETAHPPPPNYQYYSTLPFFYMHRLGHSLLRLLGKHLFRGLLRNHILFVHNALLLQFSYPPLFKQYILYVLFQSRLLYLLSNMFVIHRLPLWSSGQSSSLQVQRSGFDSRRYQIFLVVDLERGPLSLLSTVEKLRSRKPRMWP